MRILTKGQKASRKYQENVQQTLPKKKQLLLGTMHIISEVLDCHYYLIIIIIISYHNFPPPGTSPLEPMVHPTTQASSFRL
jgi:hypothetical protein